MTSADRSDGAATLRGLHRPGDPLVLPNAWDAASARQVEAAGFPAVATSSAAISAVLGYADGEATPVAEMFGAIARIRAAVAVPVTVDIERGYAMTPAQLVEYLAASGAVGCNLEDSDPRTRAMVEPDVQADLLAGVRAADPDLVINARVDSYLHGTGTPLERLAEVTERARRYLGAGADCVFPVGVTDAEAIRALVRDAGGPVNVMYTPAAEPLTELAGLGVARISFGSGLHRVLQAQHGRLLGQIGAGISPYG